MNSPRPHVPSVNRRKVLAGAAWSVPAVIAVGAAPAFAASQRWTASVTSLDVAPAAGTATGDQGVQANLTTNQTFNTFVTVRNEGPGTAAQLRAQVTFDQDPNPNEFSTGSGWVIESVTENTDLGRWVVTCVYAAPVAAGTTAPTLVVTTRTRLASAFPAGQSGAYQVLARTFNDAGTPVDATRSDYFYVTR